jgi:ribonucleotide monophosphatase NagD (HAD superfamily)
MSCNLVLDPMIVPACIGDRLETDILFGNRHELSTVLVLSGVTSKEKLLSETNDIHPDYYADSLAALLTM